MNPSARPAFRRTLLTGITAAAAIAVVGTVAHLSSDVIAADQPEPLAAPAQQVETVIVEPIEKRVWHTFSGRLEAVEDVQIRPRVSGAIDEVLFDEGSFVEAGELLFVIDKRPYLAALDRAKATVQEAESEVALALSELKRAESLVAKKSVSKSHYDTVRNQHKVAVAKVAAAKAGLTQAELDYEHAHVRAPISGRVDRAELTVGNVVSAGVNAPVLTSIVSTDRVYASFDVDEQTYINSVRRQRDGRLPVELTLSGDRSTVYRGQLHAFANQLDTTSGTIRARALLDNTDGTLLPGMFAQVRLGSSSPEALLLISDKAVGTNQDQRYVYVVNEDNEVAYRQVTLGRSIDGKRVVLSGLTSGDRVVVNSLQRVQPGTKVEPVIAVTTESAELAQGRG